VVCFGFYGGWIVVFLDVYVEVIDFYINGDVVIEVGIFIGI